MRVLILILLLLFLPGCALQMAGSMTPSQARQMLNVLRQENAQGCARLRAQGTPPASRVDLDVAVGWGKSTDLTDCLEALRTQP